MLFTKSCTDDAADPLQVYTTLQRIILMLGAFKERGVQPVYGLDGSEGKGAFSDVSWVTSKAPGPFFECMVMNSPVINHLSMVPSRSSLQTSPEQSLPEKCHESFSFLRLEK